VGCCCLTSGWLALLAGQQHDQQHDKVSRF